MNEKILLALKKSIKHWEENVKTLKEWNRKNHIIKTLPRIVQNAWVNATQEEKIVSFDGEDCALCNIFPQRNSNWYGCDRECPLVKIHNGCNRISSSWRKCVRAKGNKEIISSAVDMLKSLKKCLPKKR